MLATADVFGATLWTQDADFDSFPGVGYRSKDSWLLHRPGCRRARQALAAAAVVAKDSQWATPVLWKSEVRNVLARELEVLMRFVRAAEKAQEVELGVDAGHDLNLQNLGRFCGTVPGVLEVSIGHALIAYALEVGLHRAVSEYLDVLKESLQPAPHA